MSSQISEAPEKFISIGYNQWNNYYKPLEKRNNELCEELKKLKEDNKIKVHLYWMPHAPSYSTYDAEIGTISHFIGSNPIFKENENFRLTFNEAIVRTLEHFPNHPNRVFVSRDEFSKATEKLELSLQHTTELVKEFKQAKEDASKERDLLAAEKKNINLPRFINWVCKKLGYYHV